MIAPTAVAPPHATNTPSELKSHAEDKNVYATFDRVADVCPETRNITELLSQSPQQTSSSPSAPANPPDIVECIRQRLTNTTLIGTDFDLSFHGKARAEYIFLQAKHIAQHIELIEYWIDENELTRETWQAAFSPHDADSAIVARGICKSFESIFDIFSRNLRPSFEGGGGPTDKMLRRFPKLWGWTMPRDVIRRQRNRCAHGCGISPTFAEDRSDADNFGNKEPFVAAEFWDNVIGGWIPAMQVELYDLLFLLQRDLPTMEELQPEEPLFAVEAVPQGTLGLPPNMHFLFIAAGMYFCGATTSLLGLIRSPFDAASWGFRLTISMVEWFVLIIFSPFHAILWLFDMICRILDALKQKSDEICGWFEKQHRHALWQKTITDESGSVVENNRWEDEDASVEWKS